MESFNFLETPCGRVGVYDRMDNPRTSRIGHRKTLLFCSVVADRWCLWLQPIMPDLPEQISIGYKFGAGMHQEKTAFGVLSLRQLM